MSYFIHQITEKDRRNFKLKYLLSLPRSTYCVLEEADISNLQSIIQLTLMRESLTEYTVRTCPGLHSFTAERIAAAQSLTSSVMWITEIYLDTQGETTSSIASNRKSTTSYVNISSYGELSHPLKPQEHSANTPVFTLSNFIFQVASVLFATFIQGV